MNEAIFVADGELFVPTEHARGPWDPGALHGGAPAALISAAFERMQPGAELPFARLSFEFLRPVPMAPLTLSTRVSRPGRRVQALEAELSAAGTTVCRASALRILPAPTELPQLALELADGALPTPIAAPELGRELRFAPDAASPDYKSFASSAMQMRFLSGNPLQTTLPEHDSPTNHTLSGTATVWMRLRHPLLEGEPLSPLARVAATSDFGNGVAAVLPFDEYLFINADLTISLDRRPTGEWIALQARTLLHRDGIGWAESVLHDEHGPVGRATQALVVQRR